jgi:hypothetical protein
MFEEDILRSRASHGGYGMFRSLMALGVEGIRRRLR